MIFDLDNQGEFMGISKDSLSSTITAVSWMPIEARQLWTFQERPGDIGECRKRFWGIICMDIRQFRPAHLLKLPQRLLNRSHPLACAAGRRSSQADQDYCSFVRERCHSNCQILLHCIHVQSNVANLPAVCHTGMNVLFRKELTKCHTLPRRTK